MGSHFLFLLNLVSTWFLVGLIWLVQVVVYPQFMRVTADCFPAYHQAHLRGITYVVAPAMLVQLLSSVGLLFNPPAGVSMSVLWMGMVCVAICWISTAAIQVPLHNLLAGAYSSETASKLVNTNWIRTIAWTIHGMILMYAYMKTGSAVRA